MSSHSTSIRLSCSSSSRSVDDQARPERRRASSGDEARLSPVVSPPVISTRWERSRIEARRSFVERSAHPDNRRESQCSAH
jgi:hypothetical protein